VSLLDAIFLKACRIGDAEHAKKLIDDGANINAKDKEGITALSLAINSEQAELVRLLCERGASIYPATDHEVPPMMWSSMAGRKDIMQILFEHDQAQRKWYSEKILRGITFKSRVRFLTLLFLPFVWLARLIQRLS
jgi:ankyrin repeat protein